MQRRGLLSYPSKSNFSDTVLGVAFVLQNLKHDKSMKNCDDIALNFEKG